MRILTKKGCLLELYKKTPFDAQCVAKTDMLRNLHLIFIKQCSLSCICDSGELYLCDQILRSY
jgi:hypothetical protein